MGYLDNTSITVDAILTKKGRQKLASGQSLSISKFALGDDEIDYTLYEPAHPKGSAYYDSAIKAIPIMEASPDETQVLRYKLVTLPKGTTQIPLVASGISAVGVYQDEGQATAAGSVPVFLGEEITTTAQVVSGLAFTFTPNPALTTNVSSTVTVYGNETGGSQTIPVTITYRA